MTQKLLVGAAVLLFVVGSLVIPRNAWALPTRANPYAADIRTAERNNGLPDGLLGRLLYQESRFREDIITGRVTSSAGAVGIAQIVPRWHPNVDPLNPQDSIYYAAQYLAGLYRRFGSWQRALAAYNWGQGNLNKTINEHGDLWIRYTPKETQNYVTEITRDIKV